MSRLWVTRSVAGDMKTGKGQGGLGTEERGMGGGGLKKKKKKREPVCPGVEAFSSVVSRLN